MVVKRVVLEVKSAQEGREWVWDGSGEIVGVEAESAEVSELEESGGECAGETEAREAEGGDDCVGGGRTGNASPVTWGERCGGGPGGEGVQWVVEGVFQG